MTAAQLAQLLNGRKVGRGKYLAKCPAHGDDHASLAISDGEQGVLVYCWAGCDTRDVVAALGLKLSDLFYSRVSPAVRYEMTLREKKRALKELWETARLLRDLEPENRGFWRAMQCWAWRQLNLVRAKLEPAELYREQRGQMWRRWSEAKQDAYLELVWREVSGV